MIRASLRAKDSGRWVDNAILMKTHTRLRKNIAEYIEYTDAADILSNDGTKPEAILHKKERANILEIVNPEIWNKITRHD